MSVCSNGKRPRRVAYVLKIFPKLSETFIASELAELRRRGVDLRIFSLLPPREELRHQFIADTGLVEVTSYEPARFPALLKEFQPQLLHAHFATESTATAMSLAAAHGLPFTFSCHGYDIYRKPPPDFASRAAAARAVVTVSKANAAYLMRNFGVPAEHVHVIPCGVDTNYFRPNGARNGSEVPALVCVARLVPVKNLALLLRACAVLRDRGVDFRCMLAGEGPLRPELQAMRAQFGLEHIVQMPGAAEQSSVLKYWQTADVGVLTSSSEGMPVSLMEAAACGVPVVATNVGGVPELIEHEQTGLLVPGGDLEALTGALERLLMNKPLRMRLGENARARVTNSFSLSGQVDVLLGLWASLLDGGGS